MKFFKNLLTKVIVCPGCGQRLRVPAKPGATLKITCKGCANQFEIKFSGPKINNLFDKSSTGQGTPKDQRPLLEQLKTMPRQKLIMNIITVFAIFSLLRSCFTEPMLNQGQGMPQQEQNTPVQYHNDPPILDI